MQWTDIIDRIPLILTVFAAVAGGIRWLLQWRAKQAALVAKQRQEALEKAPSILDASLESMQDFVDFYNTILADCKGNLEDCLAENLELRRQLQRFLSPQSPQQE